jgi:hypothetical protein
MTNEIHREVRRRTTLWQAGAQQARPYRRSSSWWQG